MREERVRRSSRRRHGTEQPRFARGGWHQSLLGYEHDARKYRVRVAQVNWIHSDRCAIDGAYFTGATFTEERHAASLT